MIWVDYVHSSADAFTKRTQFERRQGDDPVVRRVAPWLESLGTKATILSGHIDELLVNVMALCGMKPILPDDEWHPETVSGSQFAITDPPDDDKSLRTLIALGQLVRHIEPFGHKLLASLAQRRDIRHASDLQSQLLLHLAHAEHTAGRVSNAIRLMKARLRQRQKQEGSDVWPDQLWIGYEHLCLTKRPYLSSKRGNATGSATRTAGIWRFAYSVCAWLLGVPVHVASGYMYMKAATRNARLLGAHGARPQALFYWADLLNSWGNLAMLAGPCVRPWLRLYFAIVSARYMAIAESSAQGAELLGEDYYWMRHLESRVLSGQHVNREAVRLKLDEIEHRYRLVQDDVQAGNTHAYRALLAYVYDSDLNAARCHLDEAERLWSASGRSMAAGKRRVALFRRFMGDLSFREAVAQMYS